MMLLDGPNKFSKLSDHFSRNRTWQQKESLILDDYIHLIGYSARYATLQATLQILISKYIAQASERSTSIQARMHQLLFGDISRSQAPAKHFRIEGIGSGSTV